MEDHSIENSSAVTEATVQVVSSSSGFGKYNVFRVSRRSKDKVLGVNISQR